MIILDERAAKALAPFMTNPLGRTSALTGVPGIVAGSVFSRLSRSSMTVAELLLTEFMVEDAEAEFGLRPNMKKGDDFFRRVFASYGDESVAELVAGQVAIAELSNIAVKAFQDARPGISSLEKSTRYVDFSKKRNGQFLYYRPDELEADGRLWQMYCVVLDGLFQTYADLWDPVRTFLEELYPRREGEDDRAWKQSIRGKVADTIRLLLPAATLTNVGFVGNARAFEYLIGTRRASIYPEVRQIAAEMQTELGQVFGSLFERLDQPSGQAMTEYRRAMQVTHREWARAYADPEEVVSPDYVRLIDYDPRDEDLVIARLIFEGGEMGLSSYLEAVRQMGQDEKMRIVDSFAALRQSRHQRVPQAFELANLVFELQANFGVYKDLQRNRFWSRPRQKLGIDLGYDTPNLIVELGKRRPEVLERWNRAMESVVTLVRDLGGSEFPYLAEYPVPNGFRMRWLMAGNLRQAAWTVELRTIPQGHPDYRYICQEMMRLLQDAYPLLSRVIKFVDWQTYGLERRAASQREAERLRMLGTDIPAIE